MHRLTINTASGTYVRDVPNFAQATEFAREFASRGFTQAEGDAFVFIPPHTVVSIRVEEIKSNDGKEKQRSKVAEGQQRKRR